MTTLNPLADFGGTVDYLKTGNDDGNINGADQDVPLLFQQAGASANTASPVPDAGDEQVEVGDDDEGGGHSTKAHTPASWILKKVMTPELISQMLAPVAQGIDEPSQATSGQRSLSASAQVPPVIDAPQSGLDSGGSVEEWLMRADTKYQASLGKVGTAQQKFLKANRAHRMAMIPLINKKMNEAIDKMCSARKSAGIAKVFGWVSKIAALVASALIMATACAATAATGGALAPVAAIAIMTMASATLDVASEASKESGGPGFSIGEGVGKFASALGASDATAGWVGMGTDLGVQVLAAVALIAMTGGTGAPVAAADVTRAARGATTATESAGGAGRAGGGSEAASAAVGEAEASTETAAEIMEKANRLTVRSRFLQAGTSAAGGIASMVGGGSAAVSGGYTIESGVKSSEADSAMAKSKRYEAQALQFKKLDQEWLDDLRGTVQKMNFVSEHMSENLKNLNDTSTSIIQMMA